MRMVVGPPALYFGSSGFGSSVFWLKFACLSTFAPSVLSFSMASPTVNLSNPWGKIAENKKARTRYGTESPFTPLLQEEKDKEYERMADEEEELVPTCPPPVESPKEEIHPGNVTMDGIAALLKQQLGPITANINALSAGVQMLDAKYGDLTLAVENRLKEVESRMDVIQAQVAKMDELVQHLNEEMSQVEGLIKTQVEAAMREIKPGVKTQNFEAKTDKRTLTAVIGNLEGIASRAEAQAWLKDKLTVLQGPAPVQIYGKGTFQGMMFAEFKDQYDRDLAVTLLKTAGLQHNGKPVWASQDRDPVERAARNFCFGLKKVFKEEWNIPYNVKISEERPYTMTVGGELALTAHVSPGEVVHEWHGAWATWDELHSSAEVRMLLEKSQALIKRMKEGMKGSSKSGPKGHHWGQLRSSQQLVSLTSPLSGSPPGFRLDKPTVQQLHANLNSKVRGEDIQNLHVYTKNARLHNDDRFGELVVEIAGMQWDIVMFSETRSCHGIIELHEGNFRHICFGSGTETFSAGVAILLHERHAKNVVNAKVISDRVMYVDFTVGGKKLRSIAAYAPHAGYSADDFNAFFEQVHVAILGACKDGRQTILGGDFNLQLQVGNRGDQIDALANAFGLTIANDDEHHSPAAETWTFFSSQFHGSETPYRFHSLFIFFATCSITPFMFVGPWFGS